MTPTPPPARRGLTLPIFDALSEARVQADLAAQAERAGWDGVFVWDHMLYSPPVRAVADPWVCLAAMAMTTERVALGPMVTPLVRRRPWVLARQAASLDRLSAGRLVLGLGLGDDGRAGELSRFGEELDPRRRAGMLDEGLDVLKRLLSGDTVEHHGRHYTVDGVQFLPRPHEDRAIPLWLAGRWPNRAPLRRAARHDGAFVISLGSPEEAGELVEVVRAERGGLAGFDVVVQPPDGARMADWAVPGVTWLLSGPGPYDLDLQAVRRLVADGPG